MTLIDRFNNKWTPEPNSGCWLWTGSINQDGYARFFLDGKNRIATRVSFELFTGNIPSGLCVLHSCDTPSCVNPNHLWLGTHLDNMRDCQSKNRWQKYDKVYPRRNNNQKTWATRRLRYGRKGHH